MSLAERTNFDIAGVCLPCQETPKFGIPLCKILGSLNNVSVGRACPAFQRPPFPPKLTQIFCPRFSFLHNNNNNNKTCPRNTFLPQYNNKNQSTMLVCQQISCVSLLQQVLAQNKTQEEPKRVSWLTQFPLPKFISFPITETSKITKTQQNTIPTSPETQKQHQTQQKTHQPWPTNYHQSPKTSGNLAEKVSCLWKLFLALILVLQRLMEARSMLWLSHMMSLWFYGVEAFQHLRTHSTPTLERIHNSKTSMTRQ